MRILSKRNLHIRRSHVTMTTHVTLFCCLWWTSVVSTPNTGGDRKLQYLVEPRVHVQVTARQNEASVLPCILRRSPAHYTIKWTKQQGAPLGRENIVMMFNSHSFKTYGDFESRASPWRSHAMDASLLLRRLRLDDGGEFRCEIIDGVVDESVSVTLTIQGVVFPYQSRRGRYRLTFQEAAAACEDQDGVLASHQQLYQAAWTEALDWCNAGWLSDGSVRYPVTRPRAACGGGTEPGIISYGTKDPQDRYDAFCFTSASAGSVFFAPGSYSFLQAEPTCRRLGARLASVGQLYAAWRFKNLDQCDGGWLRDGSVRFPIRSPRPRCGAGLGAGVRSLGFPDQNQHVYGAYCTRT